MSDTEEVKVNGVADQEKIKDGKEIKPSVKTVADVIEPKTNGVHDPVQVPNEITEAVAAATTAERKFAVLKALTKSVEISDRDLVDTVFNLLVGGEFDLEVNYIIKDSECILHLVDLLGDCGLQCQAEIWSKFKGICRKSTRNLQACTEAKLLSKLLIILQTADDIISELLIDMLGLLASYSISVKELKLLLSMLRGENGKWPLRAVKLLQVLEQIPERHGPDCFFMFPGERDAAIALPPLKAWPYNNGWTFSTWFRMDPLNNMRIDIDKPYLYCFRNGKGLGYSGHFVGNYLVITILKAKGKGFQHCLKYEFKPGKWYMVSIVHIYNRWRTSELKCYANGQLVSYGDMNWSIGANEQMDKCFLGSAESGDETRVFCGQMSATYIFSEALNPSQIYAIYQLGPDYKNQFKFAGESDRLLANHHRKVLHEDSKLYDSMIISYNPKATDGQLCLESSPVTPATKDGNAYRWFVHSPHALMLHGVTAVVTHSIHCALHSVGGVDVLYSLFSQLNYKQQNGKLDTTVCLTLLKFVLHLMQGSVKTQLQILQGKGFLVIGHCLEKAKPEHITMDVLNVLLDMVKYLDTQVHSLPLLRQFCDYIFFNPALWIHTDPEVQLALYTYLATEFISSTAMQTTIRRVSTVLLLMHSLKHYYWVVNPQDRSGIMPKGLDGPRPSKDELLSLRAFILLFLKQLVTRSSGLMDDELQAIISYLITMHEDENILDVVQLLVALMSEHAYSVAPVFDSHNGISVVFKLLASRSQAVRVHAIKLLGYFLQKCQEKRKEEIVGSHGLFALIGERLLAHADNSEEETISIVTYNALYELLVGEPCTQVLLKPHPQPTEMTRIKNPIMLKVVGNLIRQWPRESATLMEVRLMFLNDMISLFKNSHENRRTLLQQSVWQDWMLSLTYVKPKNRLQKQCQENVYMLFKILLYHAVKLEWGGWRVWVDTLAIVHSKVTFEAHKEYLEQMYMEYKRAGEHDNMQVSAITGSHANAERSSEEWVTESEEEVSESSSSNTPDSKTKIEEVENHEEADLKNVQVQVSQEEDEKESEETKENQIEQEEDLETVIDQNQEASEVINEIETAAKEDESKQDEKADGNKEGKTNPAEEKEDEPTEQNDEKVAHEEDGELQEQKGTDEELSNEDKESTETENEDKVDGKKHRERHVELSEAENKENVEVFEMNMDDNDEGEDFVEQEELCIDNQVEEVNKKLEEDKPESNFDEINLNETDDKPQANEEPITEPEETKSNDDEEVIVPEPTPNTQEEEAESTLKEVKEQSIEETECVALSQSHEIATEDNQPHEALKTDSQEVSEEDGKPSETNHTVSSNSHTEQQVENNTKEPDKNTKFSPGPRTGVFRIPEFKWSKFHLRLFDDLFQTLEEEIDNWKSASNTKPLAETVNANDNLIFVHNSLHLISQMVDNLILACGGILPILSSATSPNYELDSVDSSQGLSMETSWKLLNRLAGMMDILAFTTTLNFSEIEQEKNMSAGGILRQCLRTACICAVRNCLENRYKPQETSSSPKTPTTTSVKSNITSFSAQSTSVALHVVSAEDEHSEEEERLSVVDAARMLLDQMSNSATPISDPVRLLQVADVTRLRSSVYRDIDDSKQAQFLALAVVYFVSVLMVSKYRDVLDPDSYSKLLESTVPRKVLPKDVKDEDDLDSFSINPSETEFVKSEEKSHEIEDSLQTNTVQEILKNLAKSPEVELTTTGKPQQQVTSIQSTFQSFDRSVSVASGSTKASEIPSQISATVAENELEEKNELQTVETTDASKPSNVVLTNGSSDPSVLPQINTLKDVITQKNGAVDISARLEQALQDLEPLLRDIFIDFSSYLSKALLGSHGQELLAEGLVCMKSNSSVVELVMLLCSQEWQNSIQKNAGLAFIELINEGRLLCHAMKEHVVRVANEADFILNKQRSEDVKKHAEFESACAIHMSQQRSDERQCDMLISAAKHRDQAAAVALCNRITNIMTNKHGAWGAAFIKKAREYWKLDAWEDDTRRRRRFVKNPYGSSHLQATLKLQSETKSHVEEVDAAVSGKFPSSGTATAVVTTQQVAEDQQSVSSEEEESIMAKSEATEQPDINGPITFTTECSLIAPGICAVGTFSISAEDIFFEVNENHDSYKSIDPKVLQYTDSVHGKWSFHEVRAVFSRRYLLQTTAVEIFMANRTSVMFNFPDNTIMKKVVNILPKVGIGTGYGLPQTKRISLATPRQLLKSSNMTQRWQQREISNFEYLMFLNTIAGRTYNDLNQYPVFPWVLTNYESPELDLSLPSNYRDLSKPIGALNPKRQAYFQNRYDNWDDPNIPKFHYGTHYSNAAFTLNWLVRVEPFTSLFLCLQGGKFDHADRTFSSLLQSWKNCQRDSHDVKELIPEFFYLPEMLVNGNDYNLGSMSDGNQVNDVQLPPWAKSADDFIRQHRMALESEIVSCQLHQWIDLIFGYKQRGTEAARATNVFYYLTYENAVKLDEITDKIERQGLIDQIKNFGQSPSQLLVETHPPRSSAMHVTPMMFKEAPPQDVIMVLKFLSNSPVTHVAANTHPSLPAPSIVTCTSNLQFCVNKWNQPNSNKSQPATAKGDENQQQLPIEPDPLMNSNMGKRQISDMLDQSVQVQSLCFVVTADNKHLMSCGYWDRSIRIINTDTGKLTQVIFSHWDVVTCLVRSETYIGGDCYIVSGSRDATLLLWYWNGHKNRILGDTVNPSDNPSPRAVLTGHDSEIVAVSVCAELGLIVSASLDGPVLLHTITGDLLHTLELPESVLESAKPNSVKPKLLTFSSEGIVFVYYSGGILCNFTMNGRFLFSTIVDDMIRAITVSTDGQYILTGGDKGILKVWSAWDFKSLYTYPQCDAGIRHLDLSHDQKTVITGMSSGSIVAFYIDFNKWHYEYKDKY